MKIKNYVLILVSLLLSWVVSMGTMELLHSSLATGVEHFEMIPIFLDMVLVFTLGFIAYELAKPTVIPSFVIAIFFGFVNQNVLSFITDNSTALSILTTIGATLILFGGGLETPFTRFKSLLAPISSLAFLGTIITAFAFSFFLGITSDFFGISIPLVAIVLLGVSLASTDPAAIIPSLKKLAFFHPRPKHIAVSESALNDVVGALLTGVFLTLFLEGYTPVSLVDAYQRLLTFDNFLEIAKAVFVGVGMGIIGFLILNVWSHWKKKIYSDGEADAALFLAVPIFTFAMAMLFGGNGFLAVFVAGLLFRLKSHIHHVENFFNHTIEGFMKPLIFMLLGTLVDLQSMQQVAVLGTVMAFIFMFVLRPLVVFLTLSPFVFGKEKFTIRELLFLSFVRETGVIPAVLLVSIKLSGIPGSDVALAIGMWVILFTLILQPPFTPFVAKFLRLAKDMTDLPNEKRKGPVVVLCSRGHTFLKRLDAVVSWASKHNIGNITLLHSSEDKYSAEFVDEIKELADARFKAINRSLDKRGKLEFNFKFIGCPGKLETNLESLTDKGNISAIFVGSKMLDFRLEKIKSFQIPFVFME